MIINSGNEWNLIYLPKDKNYRGRDFLCVGMEFMVIRKKERNRWIDRWLGKKYVNWNRSF